MYLLLIPPPSVSQTEGSHFLTPLRGHWGLGGFWALAYSTGPWRICDVTDDVTGSTSQGGLWSKKNVIIKLASAGERAITPRPD